MKRVFADQSITPNDTMLRNELGSKITYYMNIMETSTGLNKRWQYINGSGWLLKIDDNDKAIYYLIACDDGIIVNLTVRDIEMEFLRRNEIVDDILIDLNHATKYSNGYAISFEITDIQKSENVSRFLKDHIIKRMLTKKLNRKPISHQLNPNIKKIQTNIK